MGYTTSQHSSFYPFPENPKTPPAEASTTRRASGVRDAVRAGSEETRNPLARAIIANGDGDVGIET